jgi:AbrB family looped-hinge helix DNA binding protein
MRYKIKHERPSRSKEAAVQYKTVTASQPIQVPAVYHVTVTDRGRLVLPAEVRARLNIRDGDPVAVAVEEDGSISVTTRDAAISHLRGMFKHLATKDHFASDDLIAERRRQARMEDREFRARTALHRRMARVKRR